MQNLYLEIRPSTIEGSGAFALQKILKGTRIIEYTGERITQALANKRYGREDCCDDDTQDEPRFYLFSVSSRTIIDGAVNGNDARFINHSCAPNCVAIIVKRRVYIEAIRTIKEGEELSYDYLLDVGSDVTDEDRRRFACYCGAARCRKTMLAPQKVKRVRRKLAV